MPIESISLGLVVSGDGDAPLEATVRVLASLYNHHGEFGSEAEFLSKASQIRDALERQDKPYPIRMFVAREAQDSGHTVNLSQVQDLEELKTSQMPFIQELDRILKCSYAAFGV